MKFVVLQVVILCICLGQIRAVPISDDVFKAFRELIYRCFDGASERFVTDSANLLSADVYGTDLIHLATYSSAFDLIQNPSEHDKIDVDKIKDFYTTELRFNRSDGDIAIEIDNLKLLKSIFSKHFPSERYNGVFNFFYILSYPNAKTKEIQSVLNYFYGVDTAATQTFFVDAHNFPELSASDCPKLYQNISDAFDKLKSINGIKTKALQDFNVIHQKFLCNEVINTLLLIFVAQSVKFQNDVCLLANKNRKKVENEKELDPEEEIDRSSGLYSFVNDVEPILSTRLSNETYRGFVNYAKATLIDMPIAEIQTALKYMYDDVPKTECTDAEN